MRSGRLKAGNKHSGDGTPSSIYGGITDFVFTSIDNMKAGLAGVESKTVVRPKEGTVAYLSSGGRSGNFIWNVGDFSSEVSTDTLSGIYVADGGDPTGSEGCWVRVEKDVLTPEMFGDTSGSDSSDKIKAALSLGTKVICKAGRKYNLATGIALSDVRVDLDLNGSRFINTSPSERMMIIEYPYRDVVTVSSVDLVTPSVTLSDATNYTVGDRVKIASQDRAIGNRPSPGDGTDYWQAQTLTISDIIGNVIAFREPFEEDFTFATNPVAMRFSKKSCQMYNGEMQSDKGFESSRNNGLIRVCGGSNHKIEIGIENSNSTAVEFYGCDYPKVKNSAISNVGRVSDTSGSHGFSFISCNGPKVTSCDFSNCRHGQTNNDTPTAFGSDYYQTGPTFDMFVSGNTNHGDIAGAYSTHHGIRRARFSNNEAVGCAVGVGIRGRDVTVNGLKCDGCAEGVFAYSEASIASEDKTTRWYVTDVETRNITGGNDLQVQECQFGTLGSNNWKGGAPSGWFFNNGGTVAVNGHQEFFSDNTFGANDNYIHIVNTNVEVFGTMSIDVDSMTTNGTNNVIRATSDSFFKAYGRISVKEPAGMDNIYRHIGTGDTVLEDVRYTQDIGLPFTASSDDVRWKGQTFDGSYSTKYQMQTITASWSVGINNSIDDEITVVGLLGGDYTLDAMPEGKFDGQKLLLRITDATQTFTLTVSSAATNIDLVGADIDMVHRNCLRFVWTGSVWAVESRTL